MGLLDLFKKKKPQEEPHKKNESDGSYVRRLKIAGSTFENEDGSSRQKILKEIYMKKPPFDKQLDLMIQQFEYDGAPAYHFFVNGQCIGSVEQKMAEFITKNQGRIQQISDFKVDRFMPEDGNRMIYYANAKIKLYTLQAVSENNKV